MNQVGVVTGFSSSIFDFFCKKRYFWVLIGKLISTIFELYFQLGEDECLFYDRFLVFSRTEIESM